jgi:hypothetical protein
MLERDRVLRFRNTATVPCTTPGAKRSRGASSEATLANFARSLPVPLAISRISLHRPLRGTPRCALLGPGSRLRMRYRISEMGH